MTELPRTIPLFLSAPHPCSYLDKQTAQTLFIDPATDMQHAYYSNLIGRGFRRSGRLIYRQHCEGCQKCISVRVPVDHFDERRRHRRIHRVNQELRYQISDFALSDEHYALYRRYTGSRHSEGEMAKSTASEVEAFLTASWSDTRLIEFSLREHLVCVAATDFMEDGLSAVYTFFEPDLEKYSLGTYAILTQIALARELGLPYLYLGFWVPTCKKMAYKQDFRPLQVFSQQQWMQFAQGENIDIKELD